MLIAQKIVEEAKSQAETLVTDAKVSAVERVKNAKAQIELDREAQIEKSMARAVIEAKQAEQIAKNQSRKDELRARQTAIDEVFALAGAQLKKESKLADALKKKFAKTGDKVEASKEGGIIIENPNYTLSLTLSELLAGLRGEIELAVAKKLF